MSFVGVLLLWSAMQHPEFTAAAQARQPTGYVQSWGTSFGTVFNDEGRGVTVTSDGSVVHATASLNYSEDIENFPMAHVRKWGPTGELCWTLTYTVNTVGQDWVAPRALCPADRSTELSPWGPEPAIAYVAGLYRGTVDFGVSPAPPSAERDATFVARIVQTSGACPGSAQTSWVVVFRGEGRNAALAIASGRQARPCADQYEILSDVHARIVVAGFFEGETTFGRVGLTLTATAEDAYVATIDRWGMTHRAFAIGGPGNQRITALAIDERTLELIVAGWYDHPNTNFNPDPFSPPVTSTNYQGGRDLFVARIHLPPHENPPQLLRLYTIGTPLDDEAACVALGVDDDESLSTLAFVGGWTTTPGGGRDLYFAAIKDDGAKKWTFNPVASGDDRVLGVSVDGLGRPVFVGQFGCPHAPTTACAHEAAPIDFDPSEAGSLVLTPDFLDAFVVRFHPTEVRMVQGEPRPRLDWAYRIGGGMEESASAVAFDPAYTGRFALTGWFGRPDAAPGQYTIDLDPGPGVTPVTSAGFADSFLSVLAPAAPEHVGFQVSLVLDQSESMHLSGEFSAMLRALHETIADPAVIPRRGQTNPGGGTRFWSVQMNAVVHTTRAVLGQRALVVMPWTVIDQDTAPLFARRLGAMPERVPGAGGSNRVGAGLRAAAASLARSGVDPLLTSTTILLIDNEGAADDVEAARVEATAPGRFDRICVLGSMNAMRDIMLLSVVMPRPGTPDPTALDIDIYSSGFAGHVLTMHPDPPPSTAWPFRDLLRLMLTRVSWCVSDYDRDESHQPNDPNLLAIDSQMCAQFPPPHPACNPYADWNFDGIFDAHLFGIDWEKLVRYLPGPCP